MSFMSLLEHRWQEKNFLCVGLDVVYDHLPAHLRKDRSVADAIFDFNRTIIETTHDHVCAYKPNTAFYEACGWEGLDALRRSIAFIKTVYPSIPVILDAKRADIDSSNEGYVHAAFDMLGADAITVHPYLGKEALQPFLQRKDRGVFVLVKTSNKGAGEFQDLVVDGPRRPLYQVVAGEVANSWNENRNCGVVVGATYPDDLRVVRSLVGDMPILIPGVGVQGGELDAAVAAGRNRYGAGIIVNASRAVIYASKDIDYAEAAAVVAREMNEKINGHL